MENKNGSGKGIPKIKLDYCDPDILTEIEGLARNGYDDGQIANILGVAANTFSRNKKKKTLPTTDNKNGESLLSRALKKGRQPISVLVENSLFQRAVGMTITKNSTTCKYLLLPDGTQTDTKIIRTVFEEIQLPPDTTAAIFWLKNHMPDIYNSQLYRGDATSNGEELDMSTPLISKIEHIFISNKIIENTS